MKKTISQVINFVFAMCGLAWMVFCWWLIIKMIAKGLE